MAYVVMANTSKGSLLRSRPAPPLAHIRVHAQTANACVHAFVHAHMCARARTRVRMRADAPTCSHAMPACDETHAMVMAYIVMAYTVMALCSYGPMPACDETHAHTQRRAQRCTHARHARHISHAHNARTHRTRARRAGGGREGRRRRDGVDVLPLWQVLLCRHVSRHVYMLDMDLPVDVYVCM